MRKRSTYRPRPKTPPMLVNRGLINDELETRERMVVEAFAGGWAGPEHFDTLADMRNVLTLAAAYKGDDAMIALCDAMRIPMANLRDRHARLGRFGLTGDELRFLREFVTAYGDFWLRQPVKLYEMSCDELTRFHQLNS